MSDFDVNAMLDEASLEDEDTALEGNVITLDDADTEPSESSTSSELYEVSDVELSSEEAKEITENIRSTGEVLYVLVSRAHAGKAHKVLGYSSFESYVKEEFGMSRSRAYQLIGQANVISEITNAVPEGTKVDISESAARDLKGMLDKIVPSIEERTSGLSPEDASDELNDVIDESRESKKSDDEDIVNMLSDDDIDRLLADNIFETPESYDEELMGDFRDREGFSDSSGSGLTGGGSGGSSGEVTEGFGDFGFDDFPEMDEDDLGGGSGESPSYDSIYDFYNILSTVNSLPEPSEIINQIAEARKQQVSDSIGNAVSWITTFNELWEKSLGSGEE